jgi:hypothetical protein
MLFFVTFIIALFPDLRRRILRDTISAARVFASFHVHVVVQT